MRLIQTGALDIDIAAREAEVADGRQRIEPLAFDDIPAEAKQLLVDFTKSLGPGIRAALMAQRGGDEALGAQQFPATIATMLRHPDLYRRQLELNIQLVGGGAISSRERELVILRVAWLCRAPNVWGEHVEIAKLCGLSAEEIERATQGSSAPGWSDHERAVLRAVEELLGDQSISDDTWNALAGVWSETALIELPVLVGMFHTAALQQNSLKVRLSAQNKGLRHR
jgi:alkylhydroperoxidase family enzyme